jgi:hypothetical protein
VNYALPSAPLSIGGVLDNAIRLYRYAIRRCWALALIYTGLIGGFSVFWVLLLPQPDVTGRSDPKQALALLTSPVMIGGLLLVILIGTVFYGALVKAECVLARKEEPLSLGAAIAAGLGRMPGMLLGLLLVLLSVMVGSIALIIPGIYLFGKFQLWMIAMFMDDLSAVESLKTSWRLTRKRWWRGTAIVTVALILLYVFALAFGLVSGAIAVLAHLSLTQRMILNQVFSVLANVIVFPMVVAVFIVMYHDFKLRSEGGDLADRVGALSKA